jgi:hypothetical protein
MMNPEGQCFAFDSRGVGYGRGEGVGTVILKRLSHAIEDGDPVHAVILNSALNQDGKTAGITLPNPNAQAALIKHVYESAKIDPAKTLYVEAHGTVSPPSTANLGTRLTDNFEIQRAPKQVNTQNSPIFLQGILRLSLTYLSYAYPVEFLLRLFHAKFQCLHLFLSGKP